MKDKQDDVNRKLGRTRKSKWGNSVGLLCLTCICVFVVSCKISITRCHSSFLNEIFSQSKDIATSSVCLVFFFFSLVDDQVIWRKRPLLILRWRNVHNYSRQCRKIKNYINDMKCAKSIEFVDMKNRKGKARYLHLKTPICMIFSYDFV